MNKRRFNRFLEAVKSIRESIDDETALDFSDIYPAWNGESISYAVGDRVLYNGTLYKCLQAHTSQSTWNPADAVSLWAEVLNETIAEWVQPDSTNPYMKGDKVLHNGKTWISIVDNNVWEPSVYGWEETA